MCRRVALGTPHREVVRMPSMNVPAMSYRPGTPKGATALRCPNATSAAEKWTSKADSAGCAGCAPESSMFLPLVLAALSPIAL